MTSEERKEARYQRRKARRHEKKRQRNIAIGNIAKCFSYHDMFYYGRKCCNGVRWKQSVQNFERHLFSGTAKRRRLVCTGRWKPGKYVHFTITERGKTRPIDAPHITDRQVHKVLTQNVLIPLYEPSMIYDNGASQKGKGLHFHYERLKDHLRQHYRRYGQNGVVLLMDFHHFFPSAPHTLVKARHQQHILWPKLRALSDAIVDSIPGDVGMPLGVEPSQLEMVALPTALDQYMKCQLGIHGAGHYMDDYYMILPDRETANRIRDDIVQRAGEMGLQINRKKCSIVDLHKPFRFCKIKFQLTATGRVITHGNRAGMQRARRKMRYFRRRMDAGEMTLKQVSEWLKGQIAYFKKFNDHGRILRLNRLFYALFIAKEAAYVQNC